MPAVGCGRHEQNTPFRPPSVHAERRKRLLWLVIPESLYKQLTVTKKKDRMPWHDEPFVNLQAAHQHAMDAARHQPGDPNSPAVKAYVTNSLVKETDILSRATKGHGVRPGRGGRNDELFLSAANLFEFVAAGALTEGEVLGALENACRINGLIEDDGHGQFEKTVQSGRRKGLDNPRDLSHVGVWDSRLSLQQIYLAALSRMCPPWAVLGYCAARALALVRPHCVLPAVVGGPGSLNWFCAIAAKSGGGKSSSHAVARELVNDYVLQRNLGSGEGLVDAYVKPANKETGEPKGMHEAIMFVADEIDNMAALGSRNGATLNGNLRIGFTSDKLGFSYRQASDQHLDPHSYRMTLVVNVQPARAGALLDDVHGGMLQRFMWFPGIDHRIDVQTPEMPGALDLPSHSKWMYPRTLQIPYEAKELIRDERMRAARGESDPLAGHALFIREKFAYALAVLDGRDEMSYDDWRLAGIASRVSDRTREWVVDEMEKAQHEDAAKRGELMGISQSSAEDAKANAHRDRMNRISNSVLKKITTDGTPKRELTLAIAYRDRVWLPTVLDRLAEQGRIARADSKTAEIWKRVDE
jgi:hypothetical protein